MKNFAPTAALALLAACGYEEQGRSPYIEKGTGSSDPILVHAQAEAGTNAPAGQEEEAETDPSENSSPAQDRTGETEPDTGDDGNPESAQPEPGY